MRIKTALTAAAAAALLLVPVRGEAQVAVGPTLAFHDEADFGVGAMITSPLPSLGEGLGLMGDFTFFFPGDDAFFDNQVDVDFWELNANLTWDIPVEDRPVAPFVLGGLNLANVSVDIEGSELGGSNSDTEIGLNIGGGLRFPAGNLEPLVGIRAELSGGEGVVIFGALPFTLGGG
jgi:hypothetical protein